MCHSFRFFSYVRRRTSRSAAAPEGVGIPDKRVWRRPGIQHLSA